MARRTAIRQVGVAVDRVFAKPLSSPTVTRHHHACLLHPQCKLCLEGAKTLSDVASCQTQYNVAPAPPPTITGTCGSIAMANLKVNKSNAAGLCNCLTTSDSSQVRDDRMSYQRINDNEMIMAEIITIKLIISGPSGKGGSRRPSH